MTTHATGLDLKTYINGATHASPTWTEVKRIMNESLDLDKVMNAIKNRESAYGRSRGSVKGIKGSFTYHEKTNTADTIFDDIFDSWEAGTIIELAFMDGNIATAGNKGFRAGIEVSNLKQKRELEGVREWEVTFELAEFVESSALVEPDRYEVP